ncbi:MAG: prephenate dehydrogenase/arogenate dehydrogenase family protein [Gemmatimonadota bacterium]
MRAPVTLVGYGRFGRALAGLLLEAGNEVVALDPEAEIPAGLVPGEGRVPFAPGCTVFLCVPVISFGEVLRGLRPRLDGADLVIDVSSVRTPMEAAMAETLGRAVSWVGTHPLFGPSSIALGERPLRVVVCPNPLHPDAASKAAALYRSLGCEVIEEETEAHDRGMAYTHALAFFLAKGMLDIEAVERSRFVPPSFRAMLRTIDSVRSDAGHLFYAIERMNPFADEARAELLDALARLHDELAATDPATYRTAGGFAIPDLGQAAPELRETRDLIDELDRELIRMLARRAELARRAGRIKGGRSLPVRDPARERSLLDARRTWAESEQLDPGAVARIFEAVLSLARGVQTPGADAS